MNANPQRSMRPFDILTGQMIYYWQFVIQINLLLFEWNFGWNGEMMKRARETKKRRRRTITKRICGHRFRCPMLASSGIGHSVCVCV